MKAFYKQNHIKIIIFSLCRNIQGVPSLMSVWKFEYQLNVKHLYSIWFSTIYLDYFWKNNKNQVVTAKYLCFFYFSIISACITTVSTRNFALCSLMARNFLTYLTWRASETTSPKKSSWVESADLCGISMLRIFRSAFWFDFALNCILYGNKRQRRHDFSELWATTFSLRVIHSTVLNIDPNY